MKILILFIVLIFSVINLSAQVRGGLFDLEFPSQIDTNYYPFYNGVQMIEVDHLGYYDRKNFFLEQSQPRAMPHSMFEPAPPPNEYIFRDSTGQIVKAFNTLKSIDELDNSFKNIPIDQKGQNPTMLFFPSHLGKSKVSDGVWVYSYSQHNNFMEFYKVFDLQSIDSVESQYQMGFNGTYPYKCGLIDSLGNIHIPMIYENMIPVGNCMLVQKDGKYGLIDYDQKEIVKIKYDSFKWETSDLISFMKDGRVSKHYNIKKDKVSELKAYDQIINPQRLEEGKICEVKLNGKSGFIDDNYNEIVEPQYDICLYFGNQSIPLFRVVKDGKWGYINDMAEVVLPCVYDDAEDFNKEGFARVQQNGEVFCIDQKGLRQDTCANKPTYRFKVFPVVQRDQKYGLLGTDGLLYIPILYDYVYGMTNEPFYRVQKDKKVGICRSTGTMLLPPEYDKIGSFYREMQLAIIEKDGLKGAIDTHCNIIIPVIYEQLQFDLSGNLIFKLNGKMGMMDSAQNIIIPAIYEEFHGFGKLRYTYDSNEYSRVMRDSLYGFIDLEGKEVIPCKFEQLELEIHNDLAFFVEDGKYGFVKVGGKIIVPAIYNRAYSFEVPVTAVQKDEKWGLIDIKGKKITDFEYDLIIAHSWYEKQWVIAYKNGLSGVLNIKGEVVVPFEYDEILTYSANNGFRARKGENWIYIKP
ncbi:MAG: WG repeat-containing protein [Bacteroidales bacterium]|nr:WG repeat-containing protein [Bacteroidales bacterium]